MFCEQSFGWCSVLVRNFFLLKRFVLCRQRATMIAFVNMGRNMIYDSLNSI